MLANLLVAKGLVFVVDRKLILVDEEEEDELLADVSVVNEFGPFTLHLP